MKVTADASLGPIADESIYYFGKVGMAEGPSQELVEAGLGTPGDEAVFL